MDSGTPPEPFLTVLVGQFIGIEEPTDPVIAAMVALTTWTFPGIKGSVFAAEGTTLEELVANPVSQEGIQIFMDNLPFGQVLGEVSPGHYAVIDPDRLTLEYEELALAWLTLQEGTVAELELPATPVVAVPAALPLGTPLLLDISNQGFQSAVAVVIDSAGAIIWTNEPVTLTELVAANEAPAVGVFEIPATAFPAAGTYAVGFAATTRTSDLGIHLMDPTYAALRAGKMRFWSVTATP